MNSLIKQPSAWVPIALPLLFFVVILVFLGMRGLPNPEIETDEGTMAHLFQLWLALQPFMMVYFAIKWLPQAPMTALLILFIQTIASLAVIAPVFLLNL